MVALGRLNKEQLSLLLVVTVVVVVKCIMFTMQLV